MPRHALRMREGETSPVNIDSEVYMVMVHIITLHIKYPGSPDNLYKNICIILRKTIDVS